MTRRNRLAAPIAAAVGGLVTAAGLLAGPQATAAPQHHNVAPAHQLATTQQARAKVRDYWTPQRMRAAHTLKVGPSSSWHPDKVAQGKPTIVKGANGHGKNRSSSTNTGGPWTGGGKVVATTGKVFMTLQGVDYVCSGSVVPAQNKSVVTTAGHCVNEGPGDFVTNFEFVPGYNNGRAPYGEWSATEVATTGQWAQQGDFNYDVGFAVVAPLNGRYLTDAVGSQAIGFNQARGQQVYAFGYPAAAPYNGQTLDYASGVAGNDTYGGSDDLSLKTNLTGGCSGGPWFQNFDESTGTGTQTSVNSFGYTSQPNVLYGPYFGSVIQNAYNQVQVEQVD
ncbi:serine protease [Microlunatus sp. Gsoil 973]|uniref:trypsin-like serine peptidase n=1 Tax=Microlunatus sp. Gsoil 973 TaxID=2672569 RepID=UPI0012B4A975|nr:peptidase [Microlunatus sp. Gsoil 973]QGN32814.1 peptidase [Microlunatus sp. Gsoil 973]